MDKLTSKATELESHKSSRTIEKKGKHSLCASFLLLISLQNIG